MSSCTWFDCEEAATQVIAVPLSSLPCVEVNPYCDDHAVAARDMGGCFASGAALADEVKPISGIRR